MKVNWNIQSRDFGDVIERIPLYFVFKYRGDSTITKVSKGCGCIEYEVKHNEIHITWTPREVPEHVLKRNQTFYVTTKNLEVQTVDGETYRLKLKANIHEEESIVL